MGEETISTDQRIKLVLSIGETSSPRINTSSAISKDDRGAVARSVTGSHIPPAPLNGTDQRIKTR